MLTGIRTYKTFVTVNYVALSFQKGAKISEHAHAGQGRKRKERSGRFALGTLRKTRRQRQRERHEAIGSTSRTIAVHVHYRGLPRGLSDKRHCVKMWRQFVTKVPTADRS